METATLCYPVVDGEVLLIRKRRGLGEGNLVGPGGKVEAGETPAAAVRREVREELRVEAVGVERVGVFEFHFGSADPDDDSMLVHAFRADGVDGTPEATPEADPEWHPVEDLPYDEMWVDDRIWLPHLLDGRPFEATFVLTADGDAMLSYEVELDVELD
jgi:8-oxo-dGTP diphosphatase